MAVCCRESILTGLETSLQPLSATALDPTPNDISPRGGVDVSSSPNQPPPPPPPPPHTHTHSAVTRMCITYDDSHLFTVSDDGCVLMIDVRDKEMRASKRDKVCMYLHIYTYTYLLSMCVMMIIFTRATDIVRYYCNHFESADCHDYKCILLSL